MVEISVKDSQRQVIKRLQRAMQKSYLKVLTEPLTNSDDTYKRLNVDHKVPIFVYITKKERKFEIVDYGEGIDKEQMKEIFEWYGHDKDTHGEGSRGLFCQGLSDVLFTREKGGHLYSIKDEEVHHIEFKWKTVPVKGRVEKERVIKIEDKKIKVDKEWREKLKIPKGNGTNVSFHFHEADFPDEEDIVRKLCNFYMLRFITSDPLREVKVVFLEDNKIKKELPIESSQIQGDEISSIDTSITYKKYPVIKIKGKLYKSSDDLPQEDAGEDRVGGILIYDEFKNVYDLTLFGYDSNPHAKKFFGFLELSSDFSYKNSKGFKQIIRRELNDESEEILTETRDGFVKTIKKNTFYFKLKEVVDTWMKKYVELETDADNQGMSHLTEESIQEQKKAFDALNKLYMEYNKITSLGVDPGKKDIKPENGIEFDRGSSIITEDKHYYVGLRVDVEKVPIGTKIKITSDDNSLKYEQASIEVKSVNEYGVCKANIKIRGSLSDDEIKKECKLTATTTVDNKDYNTTMDVTIIEEEIYMPQDGFEFNPNHCKSKPGSINKLHLYIDSNIVSLGSSIQLTILNGQKIKLTEFDEITFDKKHIIKDNIGMIKVPYVGYKNDEKGQIQAKTNDKSAIATVEITLKEENETGKMFDGWDYKPLMNWPLETFYNEDTRKIEINSHIEQNKFLGKNLEEATANYEKYLHCQIIVAERIIDECITLTVTKAFTDGKILLDEYADPITGLRIKIAQEKKKVSGHIIKHFVKAKLLAEINSSVD